MGESEEVSSSSWRFSMELLSHVHTLRVFLFNSSPQVKPDQDCGRLEATLLSAPPTVSCTWKTAHEPSLYSLRLPLPLLPFDYFAPLRISALPDCIQLSLALLPLPPFHLHAFSSLSLAHDGTHIHDRDGICVHNSNDIPRVDHEDFHAANGIPGDCGSSHSSDGDKSHTHDDTHVATHTSNIRGCCHHDGASDVDHDTGSIGDNIPKSIVRAAADVGCGDDDNAHKSHERDDTHAIEGLASLADNNDHNGTHEVGHVATSASNIRGCHHDCVRDDDLAGDSIHPVCQHDVHACDNICSHEQPTHRPHHKDDKEAHGTREIRRDAATAVNFPGCHNDGISEVHADNSVHGGDNAVCADDSSQHHHSTVLNSSTRQDHKGQISQGAVIFRCKECLVKVSRNPVRNLVQLPCFDWRDIVENWFGACCCSFGSKAEILSASFEKSLKLTPGKCLVGLSTFYVDFSDVTVETESVVLNTDSKIKQPSTLHFLALGNGFMVWENQQSKYFSWLPVYCTGCALLIGAYACKPADSGLIREGLHLFRCQITAFNADGTLYDTHRHAAYKELLAKELRRRTEENTSYRFLIRSLSSQLPVLKLMVLSYDSLICTGKVTAYMIDLGEHPQSTSETTSLFGEVGLQQSMKVLFLDCSGFSANEIRSTECWVQDYDAETIFMLEEFVDILKRELLSNRMFYPAACGLSQDFHGSFIHTSQE